MVTLLHLARRLPCRQPPGLSRGLGGVLLVVVLVLTGLVGKSASPRHGLFSEILAEHVRDGLVDYAALTDDARLDRYLGQLAETNPEELPTDTARLALWINAYNAYTLKLVADAYPLESIHDLATGGMIIGWLIKRTAWDIRMAEVGGEVYTLNEIEHAILRPRFQDPRIHFAIVCAAVSCPPLRSDAYEAATLNEQLDEQGRLFLRDERHNRFDRVEKRAQLSKIFSWFGEDFGPDDASLLRFVADFLPPDEARTIKHDPVRWRVGFRSYDWSLNDQPNVED